jgi:hypothetical protein
VRQEGDRERSPVSLSVSARGIKSYITWRIFDEIRGRETIPSGFEEERTVKVRMEDKNLKELSLEELEGISGGYNDAEWAAWTRAWKDWWIDHYGGTRCGNCGNLLAGTIEGYDKDMAYDVYMNNAFMCTCGQVIRPVKGWKK